MNLAKTLGQIEIFHGLAQDELEQVARLCETRTLKQGEVLVNAGDVGDEFYLLTEGSVSIQLPTPTGSRPIIHLGKGQVVGELALLDQGVRAATVQANETPTTVQVINNQKFLQLCEENNHIGYIVMRNLAIDLSVKLRHYNLLTNY
ncbi:MAG: cyclic nucleotide-binding domain-containing protein [Anaerolineae bacterium]|nr:MAG: cyclic nucleotide-binding domain-containing protein [Anaerolineae bacterium]